MTDSILSQVMRAREYQLERGSMPPYRVVLDRDAAERLRDESKLFCKRQCETQCPYSLQPDDVFVTFVRGDTLVVTHD